MEADGPYTSSWQHYNRWYFASLGLFIGYLPTFVIASALFPDALNRSAVVFPLFLIYAGAWVTSSNIARRWKCPRCGEPFFGSMWLPQWPMAFVQKCRYCGLPKSADRDPDRAA